MDPRNFTEKFFEKFGNRLNKPVFFWIKPENRLIAENSPIFFL